MKRIFLFVFLYSSFSIFSQIGIKGGGVTNQKSTNLERVRVSPSTVIISMVGNLLFLPTMTLSSSLASVLKLSISPKESQSPLAKTLIKEGTTLWFQFKFTLNP
jgi:hypothetical protein